MIFSFPYVTKHQNKTKSPFFQLFAEFVQMTSFLPAHFFEKNHPKLLDLDHGLCMQSFFVLQADLR